MNRRQAQNHRRAPRAAGRAFHQRPDHRQPENHVRRQPGGGGRSAARCARGG